MEPFVRVLEAFHEEVAHDGVELVHYGFEDVDALGGGFGLGVGDHLAADVRFEVIWVVALVGGHEVVVERDGVGDELDDAGGRGQGQDFVCSDAEAPLACGTVSLEKRGHLGKDLLHDGVLAEVVVAGFELGRVSLRYYMIDKCHLTSCLYLRPSDAIAVSILGILIPEATVNSDENFTINGIVL